MSLLKSNVISYLLITIFLISCENDLSTIEHPVTGEKIDVAKNDFSEKLLLQDAIGAVRQLGEGWRLPSKEELTELYKLKDKIGGFNNGIYVSSSLVQRHPFGDYYWGLDFENGELVKIKNFMSQEDDEVGYIQERYFARPVRKH